MDILDLNEPMKADNPFIVIEDDIVKPDTQVNQHVEAQSVTELPQK